MQLWPGCPTLLAVKMGSIKMALADGKITYRQGLLVKYQNARRIKLKTYYENSTREK